MKIIKQGIYNEKLLIEYGIICQVCNTEFICDSTEVKYNSTHSIITIKCPICAYNISRLEGVHRITNKSKVLEQS